MRLAILALALAGCFHFPIEGVPVDSGVPGDDLAMMMPSDLAGADLIGTDLIETDLSEPVDLFGADLRPMLLQALAPVDVVGTQEVAIADFDNDGTNDLMVVGHVQNQIGFYAGQAAAPYIGATAAATLNVTTPYAAVVSTLNGDGVPDVAFTSATNNNVVICLGSSGAWPSVGTSTATGMLPVAIAAGDLNGDGVNDLVTANASSSNVSILLGNGNGAFTATTPVSLATAPRGVAIGRVDNNLVNDLVIAIPTAGSVQISINTGNATFLGPTILTSSHTPQHIRLADIDKNNMNDLVFTNSMSATAFYTQTSNLAWFGPQTTGSTVQQRGLAIVDIDGDTDLDLITTDANGVNLMLNKGSGIFDPPLSFAVLQPNAIAVGDLTGDGRPEVVVTSNYLANPPRVTILRNNF